VRPPPRRKVDEEALRIGVAARELRVDLRLTAFEMAGRNAAAWLDAEAGLMGVEAAKRALLLVTSRREDLNVARAELIAELEAV
jgi:hypothetical protein